ncbi:MAG: protein kinase [Planctomycetes bacterium]|nr:protein kinase [Planctomycetota bacterium]
MSPSIDSLLEQCILALESGDQARVDELIAAYPEHAFGLRERLAHLASLGILQPPRTAAAIPEQLGEFRLLRQIGRGGMGVVYLAEQESLRRQVALKLVHPEHLFFDDAHERFRRETLAVARLQHPGIVPIITCGDAGGIPYYAMELVHGASLAEVLQELGGTAPMALDGPALHNALQRAMAQKHDVLPVHDAPVFHGTWTNVVCRLLLGAATALQHAHEHGVLHRDLKPSNLLLAADGNVRLIDFGLATAEGDQRITRSGSTLGSLPYMAPEQVRGETNRIDARTDVYQLGVALYELLTLWLPHGDGRRDTRERILAGNAAPPSRLNPQVHPDIDAVCSCAMDPDPARRYASAREFADDLRAFLEQRHVRARRPSPWLRLQRWVRRRPFAAAGALIGFVLLVPAPLLFALQQQAANLTIAAARDDADRERKKAVDNLAEADHQRELALRNLDHAIASVQQMLVRTAEARLGDVPRTARLRRQLLEDAVQFYERLAASVPSDAEPRLLAARAGSQLSLGELQISLGSLDVALPGLQATLAELERLALQRREGPARPGLLRLLGRCHGLLATVHSRRGEADASARAQQQCCAAYDQVAGLEPTVDNLLAASRAQLVLAKATSRAGDAAAALATLDGLEQRLQDAATVALLPARERLQLRGEVADHRGVVQASSGSIEAACHTFTAGLQVLTELPVDSDDKLRELRAGLQERLGMALHQRRDFAAAAPMLDQVCADYEHLAAAEPELPWWRYQFARVLGTRAENLRKLGDDTGGQADTDRAVALLQQVVAEAPLDAAYRSSLAVALAERADRLSDRGDAAGCERDFSEAEAVLRAAIAQQPGEVTVRLNLAATLANHANASHLRGDPARAVQLTAAALASIEPCSGPEVVRNRIELLQSAGTMLMRAGDAPAAAASMQQATELAIAELERRPQDQDLLAAALLVTLNRGIFVISDDVEAAISIWQSVLPHVARATALSRFARHMHGMLLLRLADAELRRGDTGSARGWFAKALDTGITRAQAERMPPLDKLFDDPALRPAGGTTLPK